VIPTSGVRRGFSRPGVLRLDGTIGAIRSNDRTGASAAHRFHDVRMNTPGRAPLSVAALLLAVALLPIGCGTSGPPKCSTASNAAPCTRAPFVGNSYTYVNDLPTTFADLAVSGGRNVEAGMVASGGETLAQHAVACETLDKVASASWTFVVLQEQCFGPTCIIATTPRSWSRHVSSTRPSSGRCGRCWGRPTRNVSAWLGSPHGRSSTALLL
jgi:hypothetical protein